MGDQNSPEVVAALRSGITAVLETSEPLTKKDLERRIRAGHPELRFNRSLLTKVLNENFRQLPSNHRFFPIPLWTTNEVGMPASVGSAQSSRKMPSRTVDGTPAQPRQPQGLIDDDDETLTDGERPATADDERLRREKERRRKLVSQPTSLDFDGINYRKGIAADSPQQKVGDRALGRMRREQPNFRDLD